uniref:C40 family peptidase n=1 Tax=Eubacterium cellulosolvens TaxID=29322 RepID=UPI0006862262|nr:C40 family peptidase [[Eubacterium] cellulosolvens]
MRRIYRNILNYIYYRKKIFNMWKFEKLDVKGLCCMRNLKRKKIGIRMTALSLGLWIGAQPVATFAEEMPWIKSQTVDDQTYGDADVSVSISASSSAILSVSSSVSARSASSVPLTPVEIPAASASSSADGSGIALDAGPEDGNTDNGRDALADDAADGLDVEVVSEENASVEAQAANNLLEKKTNEELIAGQHIVDIAPVVNDFRFYLVDRVESYARGTVSVREEMSDESREVGVLPDLGQAFELRDEGNGWIYIESGTVRGFVRTENLIRGDEKNAFDASYEADDENGEAVIVGDLHRPAKMTVTMRENKAYFHIRATVYDRVVPKVYAFAVCDDVNIRESANDSARIVGTMNEGMLAYILAGKGQTWCYVESGDVRGFVKSEKILTGKKANAIVEEKGEDNLLTANKLVEPKDNAATYFTFTSVKEGSEINPVRDAILKTAASCIGNPYVWGGTSLTNGADCSGFVQTIYAQYGIYLPRVAEAQSQVGIQIPVANAEPGDLIFFAKDGYVYHVAIYAGDGKTIEAFSSERGIIANTLDTSNAVWATRVIGD